DDTYRLQVRHAGFVPILYDRHIGPANPGQDFTLTPAPYWDNLEAATSWGVGAPDDNATGGIWTRETPLGTGPRPPSSEAQARQRRAASPLHAEHEEQPAVFPNMAPYMDHTPGTGTMCFVTGQGTDSTDLEQADVDGGKTSLTTPALNPIGMTDPVIGY